MRQKETLESDIRRCTIATVAAERAAREALRNGAWAREGPETEALKDAKMALAELLAEQDEARMSAKREEKVLQVEIQAAQAESARLKSAIADQLGPPGQSFRSSVWRLLKVAGGGQDPVAPADASHT